MSVSVHLFFNRGLSEEAQNILHILNEAVPSFPGLRQELQKFIHCFSVEVVPLCSKKTKTERARKEKRGNNWECNSQPRNTQPGPGRGQFLYRFCILFVDSSMPKCLNNPWARQQSLGEGPHQTTEELLCVPFSYSFCASEPCAFLQLLHVHGTLCAETKNGLNIAWAKQKMQCAQGLIYFLPSVHTKLYSGFCMIYALLVSPKFFRTQGLAVISKSCQAICF